jgi:hypothetical protein
LGAPQSRRSEAVLWQVGSCGRLVPAWSSGGKWDEKRVSSRERLQAIIRDKDRMLSSIGVGQESVERKIWGSEGTVDKSKRLKNRRLDLC